MFVLKQVIDPALEGKAAVITGLTIGEKVVLIGEVYDDKICVVDKAGTSMFLNASDFQKGELSLEVLETKTPKPQRTTPGGMKGRRIGTTYMRSSATVREDENLVISFLKTNTNPKGILLRDIVTELIDKGQIHWSFPSTSPSSYMSTMIKNGKPVEKVDYGRYRYKGEIK